MITERYVKRKMCDIKCPSHGQVMWNGTITTFNYNVYVCHLSTKEDSYITLC